MHEYIKLIKQISIFILKILTNETSFLTDSDQAFEMKTVKFSVKTVKTEKRKQ